MEHRANNINVYSSFSGFIHRDLKPENILLCANGVAKIGDFGLAKRAFELQQSQDTAEVRDSMLHSAQVGTRLYTSPEQRHGLIYGQKVWDIL